MSQNAVFVIEKLQEAGYAAYFVGGCVRDLAMKQLPKDFDIATNAKPEQIKALFRNCRLIGRRFMLAHVYFRSEIIEVATFRGHHDTANKDETHSKEGLIVRDNVFGTIEEDAYRRDFTLNALYYNPSDNTLLDYVGGIRDLKKKRVNVIGDAETRYKEDPVRMLRALRFMSKLNFKLTRETGDAIRKLNQYISLTASARLFDEILKSFHHGYAFKNYQVLKKYELFSRLFPLLNTLAPENQKNFEKLMEIALKNTDERVKIGKPVSPAFLYAVILWYPIVEQAEKMGDRYKPFVTLEMAIEKVLDKQIKTISIPRKFTNTMRDIWRMQHFLTHRSPSRIERIYTHTKFRAAYDLLALRTEAGELLKEHVKWWTEFQTLDQVKQQEMIDALQYKARKRPKKQPSFSPPL